jgi:hypothetical protein
MLLGGMYVIGVYALCTEAIYKSSLSVLWEVCYFLSHYSAFYLYDLPYDGRLLRR